jgi:hypothetical protein
MLVVLQEVICIEAEVAQRDTDERNATQQCRTKN